MKYLSFGTWRFFLAFLVVISHLWADMIHGPAAYAVWGFYVLSGYLMTYVLKHKYGFDKKGLLNYGYNRFVRIFPIYYVTVIIGMITILVLVPRGVNLLALNGQFDMPQGWGWIFTLTLIPLFYSGPNAVPVSNALGIEIGAYFLMPLLAINKSTAWFALIIGLYLNWNHGLFIESFDTRYASFLPCLLAFAVGALICHYKKELSRFSYPLLSVFIWCLHCLLWLKFPYWPWTYGLYVSMVLSAWVVISLDTRETSKLDKRLGDFSYPVYLVHTIVGGWFFGVFDHERTFEFFIVSFLMTLFVSWLLIKLIDDKMYLLKKPGILTKETFHTQEIKISEKINKHKETGTAN